MIFEILVVFLDWALAFDTWEAIARLFLLPSQGNATSNLQKRKIVIFHDDNLLSLH